MKDVMEQRTDGLETCCLIASWGQNSSHFGSFSQVWLAVSLSLAVIRSLRFLSISIVLSILQEQIRLHAPFTHREAKVQDETFVRALETPTNTSKAIHSICSSRFLRPFFHFCPAERQQKFTKLHKYRKKWRDNSGASCFVFRAKFKKSSHHIRRDRARNKQLAGLIDFGCHLIFVFGTNPLEIFPRKDLFL